MKIADDTPVSEEDYLALEAQSPCEHEYVAGSIYAMTGASLRGTPCRTLISGAKVRIALSSRCHQPVPKPPTAVKS